MATAGSPATAKPKAPRSARRIHQDGENADATAINAATSNVMRISPRRPTESERGPNTSNATPMDNVVIDTDSVAAAGVMSKASARSGSKG